MSDLLIDQRGVVVRKAPPSKYGYKMCPLLLRQVRVRRAV